MKNKLKKLAKLYLYIFLSLFIVALIFQKNFIINITPSIIEGVYFKQNVKEYKKNDVVSIKTPICVKDYIKVKNNNEELKSLYKVIYAVKGDTIEIKEKKLFINDVYIKQIFSVNRNGSPIPNVNKEGKFKLKDKEYFVLGTLINSLDSAYFGKVKENQIETKLLLVFTFEKLKKFITEIYFKKEYVPYKIEVKI